MVFTCLAACHATFWVPNGDPEGTYPMRVRCPFCGRGYLIDVRPIPDPESPVEVKK